VRAIVESRELLADAKATGLTEGDLARIVTRLARNPESGGY
jgi:hypothetical protein